MVKGDVIITEPSDIFTEEKQFYENLYTSNNIDYVIIESTLTNLTIPCINNDLAMLCEGSVLEKECNDAMMSMSCDKTPGSDGLPVNLYKIFWEDMKNIAL